jgi:hypothetical protein
MNKKKVIIISVLLICFGVISYFIYQSSFKETKIHCEYKTELKSPEGYESTSQAEILYKGKKITDLKVETYLYGEPAEKDGVKNESEDRAAFVARYSEFAVISENINKTSTGMKFDAELNNNVIKSIITVNYKDIKNEGEEGFTSLKNKTIKDTIKYFEDSNYSCNIKK